MSTLSPHGFAYSAPTPRPDGGNAPLNWPATISIATALAGAVTVFVLSLPVCVFAIVMGHVGLRHATRIGVGRGQAIGGLVIGYIAAVVNVIAGIVLAANFAYALAQLGQSLQNFPTYP